MLLPLRLSLYSLLLLGLALPPLVTALPRPEQPSDLPNVVRVNERCTGFIAWQSVVVTAAHCIKKDAEVQTVRYNDGAIYEFRLYKMGKPDHTDWAMLLGDTRGIKAWDITEEPPRVATNCAFAGYGAMRPQQYINYCHVQPELPLEEWKEYINLSAVVIGGDSGSPVYNMYGEVFGIMVRGGRYIPIGNAVKITYVIEAYKEYLKGES